MGNGSSRQDYGELLRRALSSGLQELDSTIVQIPNDANVQHAVLVATARTAGGLVFRAVGEASRDAVSVDDRYALLTLAESRAKTRVLDEVLCLTDGARAPRDAGMATLPHEGSSDVGDETADRPDATVEMRSEVPATLQADATNRGPDTPSPALMPSLAPEERTVACAESRGPMLATQGIASDPHADFAGKPAVSGMLSRRSASGLRPKVASLDEALGPDVLARLMHLTRRKAEAEGAPISEEVAMQRLESYFQRAFGHSIAEGTQIEGQRVVQRLTAGGGVTTGSHLQP